MTTAHYPPERRREIARLAACSRWQRMARVDRSDDAVTMTKPLCMRCRVLIGFDEQSGPAVIAGMGWVCWRCVRAMFMAEGRVVPPLGQVVREVPSWGDCSPLRRIS